MNSPTPVPLEKLLAHREWVRRVALVLVRDEHLASDIEQDLWTKAVERPPIVRGSLRGWIAAVLRNAAVDQFRSESSRRRREQAAARVEQQRSAGEIVAEADGMKRVVNAVMDLAEPYRATVLLRWFEDLPPREIAARQGVPVETVQTRLKRAVALLRERLDGECAGDRRAWCLALLPIVHTPSPLTSSGSWTAGSVVLGGVLMAKKTMAAAVALLLLLGGVAWKHGWIGSSRGVLRTEIVAFEQEPAAPPTPKPRPAMSTEASRSEPPVAPPPAENPAPLRGNRRVTWPVVPGEAPVPPDGAAILLRPIPGAGPEERALPAGRMVGREVVVEGLPEKFWHAIAMAPDGTVARLFVPDGADRGNETSFRRTRRIEVILKEEDGRPAAGERIEARDSGNNPVAAPGISDESGRVLIDGIHGGRADLLLLPATRERGPLIEGNWYSSVPVGTVDLEPGDARLEVVLGPPVFLIARVTEDGKPALPPGIVFGIQGAALRKRTDDPSTATVRFELRAVSREPSLTVSATVPGKSGARASAPWSEVESAFVADLQLQRKPAGTLVVSIRPPADGRFSWELRRLDGPRAPELLQGSTFWGAQSEPRTGPPDRPTFGGLKPGRYQFVADCGLATEPIEFGEAPSTREVSLDLSRVQVVSGRFEAPDGVDLTGAHVVIEGDGLVSAAKGTLGIGAPRGARHGGEFRVRVPGDRPVRLRAAHPSLVAAATGGTVEVEGAAEGVVLRLVEGAHAVLRLDPTTPPTAEGLRLRPQILLYSGDPSGEPVSIHVAEGDDPYRFGGFAPGTWTLVVDAHGLAPGVLRGVSLGPGRTDLGTIHLEEGACVRLNPKLGAGAVAPSLHVLAWPLGGPRHSRFLNYHGKGDLILRGLAKGPYRLTVAPSGSPSTLLLERRIDSEGTGEILVDLDLR